MREQGYTVLIGNELHEVRADSPAQAARLASEAHKAKCWLDDEKMGLFTESVVFVGKAPECIYNACGVYII